jgi:hypothetical protein
MVTSGSELLEVQGHGFSVDADVGDVTAGPGQLDGQLESLEFGGAVRGIVVTSAVALLQTLVA